MMTDDEVAAFEQAVRHALTMPIDLNELDAAVIQHRLQQILVLIEERRRLHHDLQAKDDALWRIDMLARQPRADPQLLAVVAEVAAQALA